MRKKGPRPNKRALSKKGDKYPVFPQRKQRGKKEGTIRASAI